ncbi:MAG: DNA polymerase III subunit gamma/tau [Defluviitaleaceae bacterium]|nr:DNA polymerase III subunit gamma/tau [Defluviitaleaceae bacterium]
MYTALYRKLRPRRFTDVFGQDIIVRTLRNQIITGKMSHAYLFCGTRGTGKTTTALILAKAVNCETPAEGEACNVCNACIAINGGESLNIIEMDAASHTGVDNIREIREAVKYPPTEGKYKVYIIDEVHMLSASAFNALLKTLEEPPDGVIFILATTDPQKIPATIHSRCQRFDFKRIASQTLFSEVKGYLAEENINCTDDALALAVRVADGSVRDCLSIMDQCASVYFNEEITLEKISELLGAVDRTALANMATALSVHDLPQIFDTIEGFMASGKDVHQFTADFLAYLRDCMVALTSSQHAARILDLSEENVEALRNSIAGVDPRALTRYIYTISEIIPKLRHTGNARILLEAALIGLCTRRTDGQASTSQLTQANQQNQAVAQNTTATDILNFLQKK